MNLAEKLREHSKTDDSRMLKQLEEVKSLLLREENREREILSALGVDSCVQQYEDKQSVYLEKQSLKKKYATDVFHVDQIKDLCIEYDLRFLSSRLYKGWIDNELGLKVKKFVDQHKISEYDLDTSFYIMAPEKQFELKNIEIAPKEYDPLLFYKIDDEHYTLVHQWGSDLNGLRYITAFRKRSFRHSQIHLFFVLFAAIMAVLGFFAIATIWSALFIGVIFASGFTLLRYGYLRNDNSKDLDENYNARLWNKDIKIVQL